jgi:hypothetical protein
MLHVILPYCTLFRSRRFGPGVRHGGPDQRVGVTAGMQRSCGACQASALFLLHSGVPNVLRAQSGVSCASRSSELPLTLRATNHMYVH